MLSSKAFQVFGLISAIVVAVIGDPTPEDRLLAEVYSNFSSGVVGALANDDSANIPSTGPAVVPPASLSSLFGLTHILAVIHEKPWPVSVPVFENLLATTPKTLPESFALLAAEAEKDPNLKLSSLIFTSDKLELTSGLAKLKIEVVNADLKAPDAVSMINGQIAKKVVTPLEENVIPKDATISPAAVALIADTLHLTETWSAPLKKISGVKFNGKEEVDFVEMVGNFQVFESDKVVEVLIPFKHNKRAISLVLPYDVAAILKGDFGETKPLNLTSVRVQLPVFQVTVRSPQASLASSSKCEFKKEDNFLQLLDEYAFVSLNQDKFEAISISGVQINNVAEFKKELAKGSKGKAIPDAAAIDNKAGAGDKAPAAVGAPAPVASSAEKVIVFNRPFSWNILDQDFGPLFSGSFESFAFVKTPAAPPKNNGPFVYGSDRSLPFEKCL